jgi:ketosteroid isomerase-like protein
MICGAFEPGILKGDLFLSGVSAGEIDVVRAWHAALNAGDVDRLLELSAPDVEVGGPRGSSRGADLLREWVARAQIALEPSRIYAGQGTVVAEQNARWRAEEGRLTEPKVVASIFRVDSGLVTSVLRYPDLPAALAAAGLSEADLAPPP